jgi:predicted transcriptional regulator
MFNIVIYADGNLKQIVLGKKSSFSSHGNSSFLYKIIDPKEVMEGIERIMNN